MVYDVGYSTVLVRRRPDGTMQTVAGGGSTQPDDGVAATDAQIGVRGLARSPDGTLYFSSNNRVFRIDAGGVLRVEAGSGVSGHSGDGGPAVDAQLTNPTGLAVANDGTLYIADSRYVRRVSASGQIKTFAGNGDDGWWSNPAWKDGVDPRALPLSVTALAVGPDGSVFIGSGSYYATHIFRVGVDGIAYLLAGAGGRGTAGDGGPAIFATMQSPEALVATPSGTVIFAENDDWGSLQGRIRRVGGDGSIDTLAGGGAAYEENGSPRSARLGAVRGLALGPDGVLHATTTSPNAVLDITSKVPGYIDGTETTIADPDGIFVFDGQGRHQRTVDPITNAQLASFEYDAAGRLAAVRDVDGHVTTILRDATGELTGIRAPYGQTTTIGLDANGYIATLYDPAGDTTSFEYGPGGLLTKMTKPGGRAWNFTWSDHTADLHDGLLVSDLGPTASGWSAIGGTYHASDWSVTMTNTASLTKSFSTAFDAAGTRTRSLTALDGLVTRMVQDSAGNNTVQSPDGTVTTSSPHADPILGLLAPLTSTTLTFPSGRAFSSASNRTITWTDDTHTAFSTVLDQIDLGGGAAAGGASSYSRYEANARTFYLSRSGSSRQSTVVVNDNGRPLHLTSPGVAPVDVAYDADGRPWTVSQSTRSVTTEYGADGLVWKTTDSQGRVLERTRDPVGRVTSAKSYLTSDLAASTREVDLRYESGLLRGVTPPGRPEHGFGYDDAGRLVSYSPPGGPSVGYVYDIAGRLQTINRADGTAVVVGYDALTGRTTSVTAGADVVSYGYDAAGRLSSLTSPSGVTQSFTYDGSLPTGVSWSGAASGTVGYEYDALLRPAAVSVDGDRVAYGYAADGSLSSAGALAPMVDPSTGFLAGTTLGGVTDAYTYDGFGASVTYSAKYTGSAVYDVAFVRDAAGRVATKTETIGGVAHVYGYTYYASGELKGVTVDGSLARAFEYDLNGNRTKKTNYDAGGTSNAETYAYDDQDRLQTVTSPAGVRTYGWTPDGDLSSATDAGGATTYVYDAFGNLRSVSRPGLPGIEYVVDGAGRRVGKKLHGVLVQGWLYGDALRPIAETDGAGSVTARYVYATGVNTPDYVVRGGKTLKVIRDYLGTPRVLVDSATGSVEGRLDLDEDGNVVAQSGSLLTAGFIGGIWDQDTGLVRLGARDYEPRVGRWTAKDPVGFKGRSTNLYRYAAGDPVNWIDPTGLSTAQWVGAFAYPPLLAPAAMSLAGYVGNPSVSDRDLSAAINSASAADGSNPSATFTKMREADPTNETLAVAEHYWVGYDWAQKNGIFSADFFVLGYDALKLIERSSLAYWLTVRGRWADGKLGASDLLDNTDPTVQSTRVGLCGAHSAN